MDPSEKKLRLIGLLLIVVPWFAYFGTTLVRWSTEKHNRELADERKTSRQLGRFGSGLPSAINSQPDSGTGLLSIFISLQEQLLIPAVAATGVGVVMLWAFRKRLTIEDIMDRKSAIAAKAVNTPANSQRRWLVLGGTVAALGLLTVMSGLIYGSSLQTSVASAKDFDRRDIESRTMRNPPSHLAPGATAMIRGSTTPERTNAAQAELEINQPYASLAVKIGLGVFALGFSVFMIVSIQMLQQQKTG